MKKNNSTRMINFFQLALKNFSTSQKGRMKTSDFRPTLKADEMALGHFLTGFYHGEIRPVLTIF